MKYLAMFSYTEPRWGDIEFSDEDNLSEEKIKEVALEYIEMSYPEALDIEITEIKELKS